MKAKDGGLYVLSMEFTNRWSINRLTWLGRRQHTCRLAFILLLRLIPFLTIKPADSHFLLAAFQVGFCSCCTAADPGRIHRLHLPHLQIDLHGKMADTAQVQVSYRPKSRLILGKWTKDLSHPSKSTHFKGLPSSPSSPSSSPSPSLNPLEALKAPLQALEAPLQALEASLQSFL